MRIHPTYTRHEWVGGTIIIAGLKAYYLGGSRKRMSELTRIPSRYELSISTRIKPYVHLSHLQT